MIREDQGAKVCEIAEVTVITKCIIHEIISDLNFCKVSTYWVPEMLTKEHKNKRMSAVFETVWHYQDGGIIVCGQHHYGK